MRPVITITVLWHRTQSAICKGSYVLVKAECSQRTTENNTTKCWIWVYYVQHMQNPLDSCKMESS